MDKLLKLNNAEAAVKFAYKYLFPPSFGGNIASRLVYEDATNTFWLYDNNSWTTFEKKTLIGQVRQFYMEETSCTALTMHKFEDTVEQLKHVVDSFDELDDSWVAFNDGSWNPVTGEFAPHSPDRMATMRVEADFKNPQPAPVFASYLNDICVDSDGKPLPGMKLQLQELAGYILLSHPRRATAFFLVGGGRNGKSVFLNVLQNMVGKARTSSLTLDTLSNDKFAPALLVGKRLNVADENSTSREAVSSVFKTLVAGDTRITAQRKFEDVIHFRPRAKFVFAVNDMALFDTFDHAIRERILVIPFFRTFSEDERDYDLPLKLEKETAGVVAWAVEGLKRLQANSMKFTKTEESMEAAGEFEGATNSVADFLREQWEKSDKPYPSRDFYEDYVKWCREGGRHPVSHNKASRQVTDRMGRGQKVWDGERQHRGLMIRKKMTAEELRQNRV